MKRECAERDHAWMRRIAIVAALLLSACVSTRDPIASAERSYFAGDLTQGLATIDRALTTRSNDPALLAMKGKLLAIEAFADTNDFDRAITTLDEAVARSESANERTTLATSLQWLGFARYAQVMISGNGTYAGAREALDRALALRREGGDARAITESTFYRGLVDEREGNVEAAMAQYRAALELAQRGGFALEESFAQRHIGFLEQKRGEHESVLARMQRSLELRRSIGFDIYLPYSLLSLGDAYDELGRSAEALRCYREAEQLASRMPFERTHVLVSLSLAGAEQKAGDVASARRRLEAAAALAKKIGYARGVQLAEAALAKPVR